MGRTDNAEASEKMITGGAYFGFILTIAAFVAATWLNKKYPSPLTTPLFVAAAVVIAVLAAFDIPYAEYEAGAKYLTYFLAPATICLAVPMYRQIKLIRRDFWPIMISLFVGCAASVGTVVGLAALFGLGDVIARSMAAISVSTAIAIGITEKLGGLVPLAVFAVILTGILGAAIGGFVCKIFKIKNPAAQGLAIGNASHAAGTIRAMEMGGVQGATSSLAIVISGLMTAALAPLMIWLLL